MNVLPLNMNKSVSLKWAVLRWNQSSKCSSSHWTIQHLWPRSRLLAHLSVFAVKSENTVNNIDQSQIKVRTKCCVLTHIRKHLNMYKYGQNIWCVSDRYERLVTVAAEVLTTPGWKHSSQVPVMDSGSSRAIKSTVWVTWTFCLRFYISFHWQCFIWIQVIHVLK
jgi:hypothetical protein